MENISKFGSLTEPFGRCNRPLPPHKMKVDDGHKNRKLFADYIHNAKNNGTPKHPTDLRIIDDNLLDEIKKRTYEKEIKRKYCYIWVINKDEIIEILWEGQFNPEDTLYNEVKHTNITGGEEAFHGGELFFGKNNVIYINNSSDRYGDARDYWPIVIEHFKKIYEKYSIEDIQTK